MFVVLKFIFFFVMEIMQTVVFIGSLFIVAYLFLAQPNQVKGVSMLPTFESSDFIFTSKVTYRFRDYEKGDVVVFKSPKNPDIEYIKRIIAKPGDVIMITEEGEVYVNDILISEPYIADTTVLWGEDIGFTVDRVPFTVPEGYLYVMGDNRPRSSDSREFGPITFDSVVGQVFYRYLPPTKAGWIQNPWPEQLRSSCHSPITMNASCEPHGLLLASSH